MLVSEKLHEYTFPSQRAVSPGGGAFWTLKLIEPPQDDSGSTANKKKTRAKCKEIDLSPWSRLREIQDLYESSASRVVLSHTNASPYIENFWRDTPSGPQPEGVYDIADRGRAPANRMGIRAGSVRFYGILRAGIQPSGDLG